MSTDVISVPPLNSNLPVNDEQLAVWTNPWANWLTKAGMILFAVSQSGTTAQRPTKNLWAGRMYFDTSLGAHGKPVFASKTLDSWLLADGTVA